MQKYEIHLNTEIIGKAEVVQEGLYYSITCKCKFNSEDIYRIIIKTDTRRINLGICIPLNNESILTKKIPIKYLDVDKLHFLAQDVHKGVNVEQYVLSADQQVVPISQIRNMRYKINDGNSIVYVD